MANSPARATVDVGSVIAGTYTIEALIGRGGMGAVFLASHKRLPGKQVAIKLLHAELHDDEVLARFKREAEIASRLGHPNIVGVTDFNLTDDGVPYLVLEYLRGESLAQRLHQGPLPNDRVLSIVRQVGSALAAAHREGIVHRDLKPANIFLVPTEVDGRMVELAKVLDFGISKMLGSSTVKTQDSMLLGTPAYMAPEQAKGEHANVDQRTDVFAFGAIVYEMLAGHPPFAGANIPEVVFNVVYEPPLPLAKQAPNAPASVVAAVEKAMAKAAADRFQAVSDFVEAMTGQPVSLFKAPAVPTPQAGGSPASERFTGQEAFDRTMGSGDHGPSPPSPRPITQHASVGGTIASNAEIVMAAPAPAPPSSSTPAAPVAPPRRRSAMLILGIALAAAAAAVVVMYLVMRSPERPAVVAAAGDATVTITVDAQVAVAVDAAVVSDASVVSDAAVVATPVDAAVIAAKPPQPTQRPQPAADPDESGGDASVAQQVAQAEVAFRGANYDLAEKLTNGIINASDTRANPRQMARAFAVRGAVQCAARNDEGRAMQNLRNIPGRFRALRQLVISTCHASGFLQGVR